ncbi:putative RNA-directed DNA polymerase from transposon X-element [Trichonephila clavipes]|nr:putative RNA-directed DNA polymerase from transposon X-element [Trichonephila clavipes]
MPLFMLSMERNEAHKKIFTAVTSIGFVKCQVEALRKNMDHPNASDARDFFTPANIAPEHPGVSSAPKNHLAKDCKNQSMRSRNVVSARENTLRTTSTAQRTPTSNCRREGEEEKREKNTYITPERLKNNSNLTLVSWNANGIRTRVDEFREFISEWNPDIINLQETHLQPCHHLAFPNYNIYRTDRTCRGGGTAILIKRSIPHHEIVINNPSFETTAIKIERTNLQPITVISAYRSPRKPILIQDLHQLFRNQDYVLVAGDLNAKHASWSPIAQQNVAGHTIRRFCDSTGYSLNAPLEPTHFHKNQFRNTVIDLAYAKV